MNDRGCKLILALTAAGLLIGAETRSRSATPVRRAPAPTFERAVQPLIAKNCSGCHNDRLASGSLDLGQLGARASVHDRRGEWEHILQRIENGEMPPKGAPRPTQAEIAVLARFVRSEWARADRNIKPDPGRVTVRRLNRAEYANTVRDLLGVEFQANKEFPIDDSGEGFDTIADVLTISPVLMEKYMLAAERLSARVLGANPFPKPIEVGYSAGRDEKTARDDLPFTGGTGPARRIGSSFLEATHRVDFDAEYVLRLGLAGVRPAGSPKAKLGVWMDGKPLHTQEVDSTLNGGKFFAPYSEEEVRLFLPEGDHVFRIGFIDNTFIREMPEADQFMTRKNKFPHGMSFTGPYPLPGEKPSRKKILVCDPKTGSSCVQKIVSTLARRAYRRPVTSADLDPLLKLVSMTQSHGMSLEQGLQSAIQALLVSPHFLYRIERDPDPTDASKTHKLTDLELASRLSYYLWSSMPDDELLGLAEAGKLRTPGVIDAQVKRMLADERSAALAENFAGQWLETRNLDVVKPDPQKFPDWDPDLVNAMKAETRLFFEAILRDNRRISDFLNAKFTFLNERLAKHYGVKGVTGPEMRRVDLTGDQRGGILSQAGVLTVSSYPSRTSVVLRGRFVLDNILGMPPPPAPADVPPLDEEAVGASGSLRQQMEKHRSNAYCASCHERMDPLGFGLENYDAIGKWRTVDGKFDVDSSGKLPSGKTFTTPAEMRNLLSGNLPDFARCLTEKMLTYSIGRGLQRYDKPTIEEIVRKTQASGYNLQTLITEVIKSYPFQSRRGEGVAKVQSAAKTTEAAIKR